MSEVWSQTAEMWLFNRVMVNDLSVHIGFSWVTPSAPQIVQEGNEKWLGLTYLGKRHKIKEKAQSWINLVPLTICVLEWHVTFNFSAINVTKLHWRYSV